MTTHEPELVLAGAPSPAHVGGVSHVDVPDLTTPVNHAGIGGNGPFQPVDAVPALVVGTDIHHAGTTSSGSPGAGRPDGGGTGRPPTIGRGPSQPDHGTVPTGNDGIDNPTNGTTNNGASTNGTSNNGTSNNGTSNNGTSNNGTSNNGTSNNGSSSNNGTSNNGTSSNNGNPPGSSDSPTVTDADASPAGDAATTSPEPVPPSPFADRPPMNEVETESGSKGAWNRELNRPQPNTRYIVDDGRFVYETDGQSRVVYSQGTLDHITDTPTRNGYQQRVAGRNDRLPGDQGGHTYAAMFDTPGEAINMTAMRDTLNSRGTRQWYRMEAEWQQRVQSGQTISVEVEFSYPGDSVRPDGYVVHWTSSDGTSRTQVFRN